MTSDEASVNLTSWQNKRNSSLYLKEMLYINVMYFLVTNKYNGDIDDVWNYDVDAQKPKTS